MATRPKPDTRPTSPTLSTFTFAPSNILPESTTTMAASDTETTETTKPPHPDSLIGLEYLDLSPEDDFDLHPPSPRMSHNNAERLAQRLYSPDHLDIILRDPLLSHRFSTFLHRYHPKCVPTLARYLESQKALAAIRYANSLANQLSTNSPPISRRNSKQRDPAVPETKLESLARKAVEELVSDALPAYITNLMVTVVTEALVKEITGNNTPLMRELVQGLAEVYCLTDPNVADNPIVFASEEFYNTTQYGMEYVIGKNCRFLQGPNTSRQGVKRISEALHNGEEISEIILNYRRDGSPFLNLVMMAPLMDPRGVVRYFIGCQIDITQLIEGGRGLESFKRLLDRDRAAKTKWASESLGHKPSLKTLGELSDLLSEEEMDIINSHNHSRDAGPRPSFESGRSSPARNLHSTRRFLGTDEIEGAPWPPSQFGVAGKLPGVYRNYLLIRPYPSLRIIYTSPALRIPGLSQSRLMDRIGSPAHIREGLLEAFAQGVGVTAKVSWLTKCPKGHRHTPSDGHPDPNFPLPESVAVQGKERWIHCTPLMGSDNKPGVWMVVMVDKDNMSGCLNSAFSPRNPVALPERESRFDGWPMRGASMASGNPSSRFTCAKLYTEYLRREGKDGDKE